MFMLPYASNMCILALPGPLTVGCFTANSAAIPKTLSAKALLFITCVTSFGSTKETNAANVAVSAHPAAVITLRIASPFDTTITLKPSVT